MIRETSGFYVKSGNVVPWLVSGIPPIVPEFSVTMHESAGGRGAHVRDAPSLELTMVTPLTLYDVSYSFLLGTIAAVTADTPINARLKKEKCFGDSFVMI